MIRTEEHKANLLLVINTIAGLKSASVDMRSWLKFDRQHEMVSEALAPTCHTSGCIFGWAWLVKCYQKDPSMIALAAGGLVVGNTITVTREGRSVATWLGLTAAQAKKLFLGYWSTVTHPDPETADPMENILSAYTKEEVLAELWHLYNTGEV